jgi:hypothetical protein
VIWLVWLLTFSTDEARRIAANIAKLTELLHKQISLAGILFSALIYINAKSQRIACQQCG